MTLGNIEALVLYSKEKKRLFFYKFKNIHC